MGLFAILLVVTVPCIISNQIFYFYPQPAQVVPLPYSLPLQPSVNTFNTITPESMGNRSDTCIHVCYNDMSISTKLKKLIPKILSLKVVSDIISKIRMRKFSIEIMNELS